jgi:hypothetical protein
MTSIQKFFMKVLPRRWAENLRAESEAWISRCCTGRAVKSVGEAGGFRWKAASAGERVMILCSQWKTLRECAVGYLPSGTAAIPMEGK